METSALALGAMSLPVTGCRKTNTGAAPASPTEQTTILAGDAMNSTYFYDKFGITSELAQKVLSEALSRGGQWADLFFEHSQGFMLSLQDGIVNRASSSADVGMGCRTVLGDQVGYAYTEQLTPELMLDAARRSAAIASGNATATAQAIQAAQKLPTFYNTSIDVSQTEVAPVVQMLLDIDKRIRAADSLVEKVILSSSVSQQRVLIVSSDGRQASDFRPTVTLVISIVMNKNGDRQSNSARLAGRCGVELFSEDKIQEMIDDVIARTRILYEAKKPKGGEIPVVLAAGESGILLHEAIGHGMEADFNRKKTSIFSTMLGQKVAVPEVNIFDSGCIDGMRGALNVDDEGTPCENTQLVENGILRSYMHDKISAAHYGVASTGSGRRESFRHAPIPRMRVTYMSNGPCTPEELLSGIKYGVYCTHFTNGQVFIGAGDYTFYVKNGYLIEDGKLTAPIKDVNIIGNGPDSLSKIVKVANDFKLSPGTWTCGKAGQSVPVSLGMPSVLVSSITVGGE